MLKLKNLSVFINKKEILNKVSFNFEKGKVYALMGPNGSGKSTLAQAVLGNPAYALRKLSRITFKGQRIDQLSPDERAKRGLFLSFQSPLSLSGVNVLQLLRLADQKQNDVLALDKKIRETARQLKIRPELLKRSLNEGFSGGERKKMEVLQAAILNPDCLIFDEIDTGLDVDGLRVLAEFLRSFRQPQKTLILITHYNRLLKYLKPDRVLVLQAGRLTKTGDYKLAQKIEKNGYDHKA